MNSDGTDRKRLTHAKNKWDNSPAWSPDVKKLFFQEHIKIQIIIGKKNFGL